MSEFVCIAAGAAAVGAIAVHNYRGKVSGPHPAPTACSARRAEMTTEEAAENVVALPVSARASAVGTAFSNHLFQTSPTEDTTGTTRRSTIEKKNAALGGFQQMQQMEDARGTKETGYTKLMCGFALPTTQPKSKPMGPPPSVFNTTEAQARAYENSA